MQCLLVDDDKDLCNLLARYLATAGYQVDAVHCGRSALQACRQQRYDIVLLDVMLPYVNGYTVLAQLRGLSQVPVIMLTAKGGEQQRVKGLDLGADDYMAKPFSSRELVARMRALLRRVKPQTEQTIKLGDLALRPGLNQVTINSTAIHLTGIEAAALRVLCEQPGRPVPREHLYQIVLHRENSPYDRSLDTHVSNLRKKIGRHPDGSARITAVRGVGYQYCL